MFLSYQSHKLLDPNISDLYLLIKCTISDGQSNILQFHFLGTVFIGRLIILVSWYPHQTFVSCAIDCSIWFAFTITYIDSWVINNLFKKKSSSIVFWEWNINSLELFMSSLLIYLYKKYLDISLVFHSSLFSIKKFWSALHNFYQKRIHQ